ncbi:MAG: glycoside hydrolase family 99-like domain-containing protein [Acidobacteriota bacterium]|nr:glycoside hydrolase family 99-like domain-containing protein [Acidobacteriota bacterium]
MKILIGLIEHFGDVVACEPVARYLREKHPGAHIAWAILKPYRELIDGNPHIDETIVLGCLTDWIKLYRHSKTDLIVDLHVNLRVCEECRVPLIKEHGNPFVNAYEYFDYGPILEAFCQGAGLTKLSAQPQVYLTQDHSLAVDQLQLPSQYCVIHRASNSPVKDWPNEKWRPLVRLLVDELGLPVVEIGSTKQSLGPPKTKDDDDAKSSALSSSVIDLVNRTSLLQTAEVIRRARFYIGVDSGPAHFANAVETPGIILLGRIGFFRQYTPFTGFYASRSPEVRLVRNFTGAVAEIPLDEVIEATRYLVHVLEERDARVLATDAIPSSPVSLVPTDANYQRMVLDSGFFDHAWYVTHYPEALQSGVDSLDYFITVGAQSGHSPGPGFDAAWYNTQRPDLVVVTDPLQHYLYFGRTEGLRPCDYASSTVAEAHLPTGHIAATLASLSTHSPVATTSTGEEESLPRIFAFYLPQFHPIAENNYGHWPGFTEWDNVIKAKPLFKGHYQPRLPGELGYYDLRSIDVMREQVKLANNHGIDGFCFYYYYFQGKKLLYKPIDNYIKSDIEAPFFFLWANENWTRRWDGGDNEIIISQNHSPEDDLAFIRELLPVLADHRYVKVQGKPVLAIYKTQLFPNILQSTELWRNQAVKNGFPGLYLLMVDDWAGNQFHPREIGFDASYEIPSNVVPEQVILQDNKHLGLKEGFQGRIVDYRKFASFHMGRPFPDYKRFRTVMAPWDNTPRYGSRAMVQINSDNDAYKLWLSQALLDTRRRYSLDERIVFLHSWNEWCEGTYVEPDQRSGRRLLEETKEVVDGLRSMALEERQADPKIAAHFRRLMRAKDEGAARSLQAMRQQNMYLYREIEHQRAQIKLSQAAATEQSAEEAHITQLAQAAATQQSIEQAAQQAADEVRQSVYRSRSWRVTKPLRAVARLLNRP